jgi:hypothetical protein
MSKYIVLIAGNMHTVNFAQLWVGVRLAGLLGFEVNPKHHHYGLRAQSSTVLLVYTGINPKRDRKRNKPDVYRIDNVQGRCVPNQEVRKGRLFESRELIVRLANATGTSSPRELSPYPKHDIVIDIFLT